eukprot:CAMPEP_0173153928 /NCGR_PEP_ID=MMETSP1105-20130129/13163_1 /TAXON_ID=2985 /ORGANISM="Ochromonas sp., Strain BG-1" /LENGTH=797 /DNA_ID=CAMNT_0014069979 /DNA_START=811 /DNA_END=3207 /DNA_ORIENTATION=+
MYHSIYGFWYVSEDHDQSAICWLKITNVNRLGEPLWFLFIMPLLFVYVFCLLTLFIAYIRLQRGLTRSFLPRLRLLVANTANVFVLSLFWSMFFLLYAWVFFTRHGTYYNETLFDLLTFSIGSKGFASYIVWVFVTDANAFGKTEQEAETIDANKSLREEVLSFATAGIRSTAREGSKLTAETTLLVRRPIHVPQASKKSLITPFFFVRFMMGETAEVAAIRQMVAQTRRASNPYSRGSTAPSEPSLSEGGGSRLSQRPTVLSGTDAINKLTLGGNAAGAMQIGRESVDVENKRTVSEMTRQSDIMEPVTDAAARNALLNSSSTTQRMWNMVLRILNIDQPDSVEFFEFEPYHFRRVRIATGITDDAFINAFSNTIKERLTQGGASGAFFFFSKGEKFIAKSCTTEEMDTLKTNAKAYADYMVNHPNSYISKIFGVYQLKIYGNYLSFFVMNNLFYNDDALTMNEKYDIKGSWVSRNATPPIEGQSVTCSYCEQKFIYKKKNKVRRFSGSRSARFGSKSFVGNRDVTAGELNESGSPLHDIEAEEVPISEGPSSSRCPYTVNGIHEPNLILKDNDIKYKIRLSLENTVNLLRQIRLDAELLYSLGIMDYSLLVGVHNTEYEVKDDKDSFTPRLTRAATRADILGKVRRESLIQPNSPSEDIAEATSSSMSPLTVKIGGEEKKSTEIEFGKVSPKETTRDSADTVELSEIPENDIVLAQKLEVFKVVGPDSYFIGIIDFQQKWNFSKKMERFFKINFRGADPQGLSAIEPEQYKERFLRKIEDILDIESFGRIASVTM